MGKPVKNLRFCEYFTLLLDISDSGIHVTAITVDHDDIEALFSEKGIFEGDDIGVSKFLQHFQLVFNVFLAALISFGQIKSFGGVAFPVFAVGAHKNITKGSILVNTYPVPISFPI